MAKGRWRVPITIKTRSGEKIRFTASGSTKKKARANGRRFVKSYMKNVAMGFTDATGFHPISSSHDYAPYRAGEFPRKGKSAGQRKAAERKAKGKLATKRARKGRMSVS